MRWNHEAYEHLRSPDAQSGGRVEARHAGEPSGKGNAKFPILLAPLAAIRSSSTPEGELATVKEGA